MATLVLAWKWMCWCSWGPYFGCELGAVIVFIRLERCWGTVERFKNLDNAHWRAWRWCDYGSMLRVCHRRRVFFLLSFWFLYDEPLWLQCVNNLHSWQETHVCRDICGSSHPCKFKCSCSSCWDLFISYFFCLSRSGYGFVLLYLIVGMYDEIKFKHSR